MKHASPHPSAQAYRAPTTAPSLLLKSILALSACALILKLVYATPHLQRPLTPLPHPAPRNTTHHSDPSALWAITYTPYTPTGACKHPPEILADLAAIAAAGFVALRLYSTDCAFLAIPALPATLRALDLGLLLGLHIADPAATGPAAALVRDQLADVLAFGAPDTIQAVVVGNDAVFNEWTAPAELAALVGEVRATLRAEMGYDGPVTAVEPVEVLEAHAGVLCPALDVAAANVQPFFDAGCEARDAGRVVAAQLQRLAQVCGGEMEAWNLETGWPRRGSVHHAAVPGVLEQRVAVEAIWREAGARSVFHSWEDEEWKGDGEWGVERYWGVREVFERDLAAE